MYIQHIRRMIYQIFREEGIIKLFKRTLHYVVRTCYFPYSLYNIRRLDIDTDLNNLVDFTFSFCNGLVRPLQIKSELLELLETLQELKPKYILEIGTANGGTLFLFSRVASVGAQIISIDLPGGRFGGGYPNWKIPLYKSFALPNQEIRLIRGNSHSIEALVKVKTILNGNKLDLLFIDGDHTYEGAKKDFEMYSLLVKNGGLLVFHDIVTHGSIEHGVSEFWHEIKSGYKYKEIVEHWNQQWAGIGLLRKTSEL